MYKALVGKLAKLPPSTKVYCGHEYTVKNLEFAQSAGGCKLAAQLKVVRPGADVHRAVDKENQAVADKLAWAHKQRAANQPTVPSTIQACSLPPTALGRVHEVLQIGPSSSSKWLCREGW